MTDEITARIAHTLMELKEQFPSMRFGQLVLAVAQSARGPEVDAAYEVTDEEFLLAAQRLLERRRQESAAAKSTPPEKKRAI